MIVNLMTHPRRYITVNDLADYTGRSRYTIYWHIDEGKIRVVRFGHLIRIETDEARRWYEVYHQPIEDQTTKTAPLPTSPHPAL